MRRLALSVILLACALASPLRAAALEAGLAKGLEKGERARVVAVTDGDTLILDTGVTVRVVSIQAPKLPLGRPGFVAWPLADEAKAALEALALGRRVTLYYGGRRTDRYGRALAHLYRDDGLWIQGELLALGMARVYSFQDNRAIVPSMLAREAAARAARLGVWRHPFYAVRRAEPPAIPIDRFELVEGRVLDVATVRNRTYINFGDDWRVDFTLSLTSGVRRLFDREGIDLERLEGLVIRARGWIKSYNGPMIEISHPEQIEILEPREP
ncbi:MAG: thermonuclease family protein [Proteobacteria bacterium]|nr:thermonuclease family protein [Pseudomonadota bacterium]